MMFAVAESRPSQSPKESAHDILAAEAFALPAPEPRLRPDVALPGDPSGIPEPHDILAAEEFAMPAPDLGRSTQDARRRARPTSARLIGLAGAGLVGLWLRRRGRR